MYTLHIGLTVGFEIGNSTNVHTKGVWVWVQNHPTYSDQYLVLLDTEGLADPQKVSLSVYFMVDLKDILQSLGFINRFA